MPYGPDEFSRARPGAGSKVNRLLVGLSTILLGAAMIVQGLAG